MARFSSSGSRSSSSSRYYGARAIHNPSNSKRSHSAYDEVAVRYPNGVKTIIHHSNYRASAIARNKADDLCKMALRAAVEYTEMDEEFRNRVQENTCRCIGVFADGIDKLMPKPT